MITTIEINDLKVQAFHGVLPQEHTVGNLYSIDLTLWVDFAQAMESDDLQDTVSYAAVAEIVKEEMAQPSALLEHVAGRILHHLTRQWPQITNVELCLAKLSPPIECEIGRCAVRIRLH